MLLHIIHTHSTYYIQYRLLTFIPHTEEQVIGLAVTSPPCVRHISSLVWVKCQHMTAVHETV